jgi:hypothetical protein
MLRHTEPLQEEMQADTMETHGATFREGVALTQVLVSECLLEVVDQEAAAEDINPE